MTWALGGNPKLHSPRLVDRIWDIWGSYDNIPKAIFYLLKGDYNFLGLVGNILCGGSVPLFPTNHQ